MPHTTELILTPRGKQLVKRALINEARNLNRSASGLEKREESARLRDEAKEVQELAEVLGP